MGIEQIPADLLREIQEFEDSKAGVKGLVDAGVKKLPRMFIDQIRIQEDQRTKYAADFDVSRLPVIDLQGLHDNPERRREIVEKVRDASEKWGFFLLVNHGVPIEVMDEAVDKVKSFHNQDAEAKKPYFSRDRNRSFIYHSNVNLFAGVAANWRDSIECILAPIPPNPDEFPPMLRDILLKYSSYAKNLGVTMFQLLAEAIGLKTNHFLDMHCAEGHYMVGHYYPWCPEPDLTYGTTTHSDSGFLTILLQDSVGGLQFLIEDQFVDVPYVRGALFCNIGDLMQLITNDKFFSGPHRVLPKQAGPRVSIACGFRTTFQEGVVPRFYGPIEELLSEDNPPKYKTITVRDYITKRHKKGLFGGSFLTPFLINSKEDEEN